MGLRKIFHLKKTRLYYRVMDPISDTLTLQKKMYPDFSHCSTKSLISKFIQWGNYRVLQNYVKATETFLCNESVTYATHGELGFLHNLVELASRWQGPISVAVYAPGESFQKTLDVIFHLRECGHNEVKKLVTFHIFFDSDRMPNVRFLRLMQRPDFSNTSLRRVYALPVFEMKSNLVIPNTKKELLSLINEKNAFLFHLNICRRCQEVPNYEVRHWMLLFSHNCRISDRNWLKAPIKTGLSVFTIGKRKLKYSSWEPMFIGTDMEPDFDERLSLEGLRNKMIQSYIMCLMNYEFHVLDNAYIIHKPGIKQRDKRVLKSPLVKKQNKLIDTIIKEECNKIYGTRNGCRILS
ncbi:Beta-1,4-glucuronyltransferase 1 [Armadillidium vulgare]|nr:Beta-1,4-glucuronyltransferase 1 [Armadillidium vulgare]